MRKQMLVEKMEHWPLEKLVPYDRNARTHSEVQVGQIAASISEFGFNNPILVDSGTGIIAGHGRLLAAQKLQLKQVPVIILDHLSETQKRAYILADNRLAELAGWDQEMLRMELEALRELSFDLTVTGFNDKDLDLLLSQQIAALGLTDEDDIPESEETAVSVVGDLWLLGKHRLLIGDATRQSDIEMLMNGELADLVFTDPPYNVDYEGYTEKHLKLAGDRMSVDQFNTFLLHTFRNYRNLSKSGVSLYVCHSSSWQREFQSALEQAGFEVRCQIIWAKNTFAWGFGRYKFQHEPIFYCHRKGESDAWYGDKSQSTLWQEKKPAANRLHPTMKPVELIDRALINSSKSGDLVVDLFGGSGSTLIACERRNRKANLMEIDPIYADVIIRRWQAFTGMTAYLHATEQSFSEVQADRRKKQDPVETKKNSKAGRSHGPTKKRTAGA